MWNDSMSESSKELRKETESLGHNGQSNELKLKLK